MEHPIKYFDMGLGVEKEGLLNGIVNGLIVGRGGQVLITVTVGLGVRVLAGIGDWDDC